MHPITSQQQELPTVWTTATWTPPPPSHAAPKRKPQVSHVATPNHTRLVLSIFPGVDLLGAAFEAEGFCVVRGPDLIYGGDIRRFTPPPQVFDGVIGGSPCQGFSRANRNPDPTDSLAMLAEWIRVVLAAAPSWALLENVPTVPDVTLPGYNRQRIDIRPTEVAIRQNRLRHFQFFCRNAKPLAVPRRDTPQKTVKAVTASEGRRKHRRSWDEFCSLQGLDVGPTLPGMTLEARYRAIGNGVPLPMGRLLARSIRTWDETDRYTSICVCGCGREITGRQMSATAACRKRLERRRHSHTLNTGNGIPPWSKAQPQLF